MDAIPEYYEDACRELMESGVDDCAYEWFGMLKTYTYRYRWILRAVEWGVAKYDGTYIRGGDFACETDENFVAFNVEDGRIVSITATPKDATKEPVTFTWF